jgi:RNA polymerase sigma-70 factor (ECF subfamily)
MDSARAARPPSPSVAIDETPAPSSFTTAAWAHIGNDASRARHAYRDAAVELGHEDAVLVRLVRVGGDHRAAGSLFDRYAPLVRRVLVRTLGPFHEVEDHVQETFIAFFRQLGTLKNEESVRAFLVSIAVRTARHELRRRRVRRILRLAPPEELSDVAGTGGGTDYEGREALRRLFAILDELDTTSRLAFTLRFVEEMELMEVAIAIGESLASVKRRLARVVPIVNARAARDAALSPYIEEDRGHG